MNEIFNKNIEYILSLGINSIFAIINIVLFIINIKISKINQQLQSNMFCYQLYDKRINIYQSINKSISKIIEKDSANMNDCIEFLRLSKDIPFLFGVEIKNYIDEMYKIIQELSKYSNLINKNEVDLNHKYNCQEEYKLMCKLLKSYSNIEEKFKDYMYFGEVKNVNIKKR